ncbi:peptide/nickel transport system substrate-binding protein/oligopeptide transport system substrate-binding protein [Jatrophihabitans endophyticus]|uniref:Peptide/nickel transport system substrate-binding protein/oligopeptide transport system substrate-binding protein n=1 Tax=Jatrophihabitans endophyticus TaxID=1206085 RepID=A0A1M5EL34_9ACTN|nr:ABC transporter substrate-binding protein [Jatrophihabitans endophyticus]SHF79781.1 peptide/nickel transport system substrate-binding protein/oligopeptide transport system substrate-binding protein [Jatrophihabitans endophyticus]
MFRASRVVPRTSRVVAGIVALGCVAATAACGGGSGGGSGGTLVVADGNSELDTLVPGNTALSFSELGILFSPIVSFNPDGSLKYVQASAVTGSNGSRTWTITFRPGWTFHNGEPVTAQSYADGWNLTAYGPNAYVNSSQLANVVGYDAVHPAKGKPTAKTLSGVTVTGRYTLRVNLTQPDSQFPLKLSQGQTGYYPMPKAGLANLAAFRTKPIGDGPYEMAGPAKLNQQVKLKKYDGYKGANKGKVANIVFRMYTSPDTAYTDTVAGNVDIALAPQDKFPQIAKDFGSRVAKSSGASIEFLGFPLFDKRFRNVKLRQAISLAVDRPAINKAIFGGLYTPADSLLATTMVGGSTHACQYCRFDATRAKQLLREAGGWSGPMTITFPGGAGYDQAFQAVANQLRSNLGIDATAKPTTNFSDFFADLQKRSVTGGPWRGKWGSAYPSATDTLRQLFTPGGSYNFSVGGYDNKAVTALVDKGDAATSTAAAVSAYHAAERAIESDFPVVPMFYEAFPFVYSSKVKNVHARPFQIDTDYEAVTKG